VVGGEVVEGGHSGVGEAAAGEEVVDPDVRMTMVTCGKRMILLAVQGRVWMRMRTTKRMTSLARNARGLLRDHRELIAWLLAIMESRMSQILLRQTRSSP